MDLEPGVLADEDSGRSRVIEVDVREQQVAHVLDIHAAIRQLRLQMRNRRRRAAVEQRRAVLRLEEVAADDPRGLVVEVDGLGHQPARADSRSSIRSSADSMPTESRISVGDTANGASAVDACVMRAGCSMRLSTPPRLSASFQIFVSATRRTASSSEPARKEIIPPKSLICRVAMSWPGWEARPG